MEYPIRLILLRQNFFDRHVLEASMEAKDKNKILFAKIFHLFIFNPSFLISILLSRSLFFLFCFNTGPTRTGIRNWSGGAATLAKLECRHRVKPDP
ncbi:hypothetical protein BDV35DRAFT_346656 [Aspergillus flavus]|uniref:Uncharacterized protein n=1 Tax=Aspergillus flavus TaxID=5059 RepID=A0A5N6H585_ASPFL|nr:hypothetical protein BDV35DRAFT_346656 [Aspergillus flavus]